LSSTPCKARVPALLGWYAANARHLPWRQTHDPYHIWISEIMLQQTQVKTVLSRYQAWFDVFPDIASLAAADPDKVLKAWEGLGYYRRARFIHAAAQMISEEFHGLFPQSFDAMLRLPGIGRSTAGAIGSFCFSLNRPVLDGNVKRVLRRWQAKPATSGKALWLLAQAAIDASGEPANWNQAMMELGAILCLPTNPSCMDCPVQPSCASAFRVDAGNEKKTTIRVRDVHWQVHLHLNAERGIWLIQRPDTGIWAGLWTPPITELGAAPEAQPCHIHQLTHRRLHLYAEVAEDTPAGSGQWVADIDQFALPTGIHRLLDKYNWNPSD